MGLHPVSFWLLQNDVSHWLFKPGAPKRPHQNLSLSIDYKPPASNRKTQSWATTDRDHDLHVTGKYLKTFLFIWLLFFLISVRLIKFCRPQNIIKGRDSESSSAKFHIKFWNYNKSFPLCMFFLFKQNLTKYLLNVDKSAYFTNLIVEATHTQNEC